MSGKFGNYTMPPDPNDPGTWTRTTALGASEQRQKDQKDYVAESLGNTAKTLAGQIPSDQFNFDNLPGVDRYRELDAMLDPSEYSADADKVEQATYDRIQNLMRPQFAERDRALDNRLAVMGLPASGEAYGVEKDRAGRLRNEADLNASLEAVMAGRGEQSRMFGQQLAGRQQMTSEQLSKIGSQRTDRATGTQERLMERTQPFNELAAILQGSPSMQGPTPGNVASYQVAPPDISGLIQNQYNTKAQNQAAKKGGTNDLAAAAITAGGYAAMSDIRLKTNILEVGEIGGHSIYTWDWNDKAAEIGLTGSETGVLAQEVEQYASWAVTEQDGYKAVYYDMLFGGTQ